MKKPVKDIIQQIYDNLFRFTNLRKTPKKPVFPKTGLLDKKKKTELEQCLGIKINKAGFFEQALTHRSYLQVNTEIELISNERLEFLGDAILGMIVAEYLFYHYIHDQEGELTKMRSWLVNRKSLSHCAKELHLERFLFLSFSAGQSLQKGNETIMADAMEAIIAAIYLDSGIDETRKFVLETMIPILTNEKMMKDTNFKSILLELVQSEGKESPKYTLIEAIGPDHDKNFIVAVMVEGHELGRGSGKSKKQAEQQAAQSALEILLKAHQQDAGTHKEFINP
jgi:ribonuclease-3